LAGAAGDRALLDYHRDFGVGGFGHPENTLGIFAFLLFCSQRNKETKKQRNKETKKQRNKETKKQRNKETK
jgi:hypothetical protein